MPPIKAGFEMGVGSRFLVVANRERGSGLAVYEIVQPCFPMARKRGLQGRGGSTIEVFSIRRGSLDEHAWKEDEGRAKRLAWADAIEGVRLDQRIRGS